MDILGAAGAETEIIDTFTGRERLSLRVGDSALELLDSVHWRCGEPKIGRDGSYLRRNGSAKGLAKGRRII